MPSMTASIRQKKSRDDNMANSHYNDNTNDTTKGDNYEQYHPLPDR